MVNFLSLYSFLVRFLFFNPLLSVLYHFCPCVCTVRTGYTHSGSEVCALFLTHILACFFNHLSCYNLVYKQYLFRLQSAEKKVCRRSGHCLCTALQRSLSLNVFFL